MLAVGSRILMADGTYKNVEEVIYGDFVVNSSGFPSKVIEAKCCGILPLYSIRHNSFHSPLRLAVQDVLASDYKRYSFKTKDRASFKELTEKNPLQWIPLTDLKIGYSLLAIPAKIYYKTQESFEVSLRKFARIDFKRFHRIFKPTKDFGMFLGYFIGNGTPIIGRSVVRGRVINVGRTIWSFKETKTKAIKQLCGVVYRLFKKRMNRKAKQRFGYISLFILYNKPITHFLKKFLNKTARHLPHYLWCSNKEYLQGLVDGLISSDGYIDKYGRKRFCTTSTKLLEMFGSACHMLTGVPISMRNNGKPVGTLGIKAIHDIYIGSKNKSTHKRILYNQYLVLPLEIKKLDVYDYAWSIKTEGSDNDMGIVANNIIVRGY